jgi:Tol biopolymer transport system component
MDTVTLNQFHHRLSCPRGVRARPAPRERCAVSAVLLALVAFVLLASGCGRGAAVRENTALPRRNGDILFSKDNRLYLMRPDGTHQRPIPGSPHDVTSASWSPDGTRIAFARELGGSCPARLYMMWPDGTHVRPFTPKVNDPVMEAPCIGRSSWSPDGTRIAFTKDDVLGSSIWVRNVDGRGPPRELSDAPPQSGGRDDRDPAWSPDGKTIIFDRTDPPGLWLMDADGSNQHRLDTASLRCAGAQEPDWSPDGEWIAFARTCERSVGGKKKYWSDIWLIRPAGTDLRRLTDARALSAGNGSPAWSPDGKRIVFDSVVSRSRYEDFDDIYVMSAGGTGQKRLVRLLTYSIAPDWRAQQP